MFADDTTLVFRNKDKIYLEAMVNEDLSSAADWLAENKLSLNIIKTNFMHFDLSRSNTGSPKLFIGSKPILNVKSQKFLGVIFDDKLSWKEHILSIISKLNSCLGATRRARPYLNTHSLFTIYYSLMQSHTQYCCETWGSWESRGNKVILQRLQAVCNKFFRLIYNLDSRDSVRGLIRENNVMNVNQLYNHSLGKTMHRAKQNTLPVPLQSLFQICPTNSNLFLVKSSRIKRTQKSITQAGPKVWNCLPNALLVETEYKKFLSSMKRHVINT